MFGKKMAMAMALGLGIMVVTPNVDAAVRPTNIRFGEGQTVQTQVNALPQVAEPKVQPQLAVMPQPQTPILPQVKQPELQNKPMPLQPELANVAAKQQPKVQQDSELKIDSALVVGLGKSNPVYDVSNGHFGDFIANDAVHKNKYALVCNVNDLQEFELCKAQLDKLQITYEPVNKAGVIPEEVEKRVASYLGTDNVIAVTFKYRDEQEAQRLKQKDTAMVKGILGIIPGGNLLGGLF